MLAIRTQTGETIFNPPAEVEISADDFLIVMGERSSLQKLEQILISALNQKQGTFSALSLALGYRAETA